MSQHVLLYLLSPNVLQYETVGFGGRRFFQTLRAGFGLVPNILVGVFRN